MPQDRSSTKAGWDVCPDQLLGRKVFSSDLAPVRELLRGKTVMVTGAAGSIGAELCRCLLSCDLASLICVDRDETGMFYLERDLSSHGAGASISFCVADITNEHRMRRTYLKHNIQVTLHAAAYKHVPVMEANVEEAVSANVFGLLSLLRAARDAGCETFLLVSSDKAVNPTSIMGCTKRIGELLLATWPPGGPSCFSIRLGNVLGSRGSVVPLFQESIWRGAPICVSDPEAERFFVSLPEAASSILQALTVGTHGDILVADMGTPLRIVDLAAHVIRLSGRREREVELRFTSLRPGEKLTEELFYPDEAMVATSCRTVKRVFGRLPERTTLESLLRELFAVLSTGEAEAIRRKLREIVPQYASSDSVRCLSAVTT